MKLIKTKLLIKHSHYSPVGFATASHLDFCKYQVRHFKHEPEWSFKWCIQNFVMSICLLIASLLMPFLILSNGLILYPYWIVLHIVKTKRIAKKYGVDYLNKSAEELVKEIQEKDQQ